MSKFKLKTIVLGMVQTNCYVVSNEERKEAIVFDPADDTVRIEQYLIDNDLVCKGILLTHGHFDHILAAEELASRTGAKIYAHKEEARLLGDSNMNVSSQLRLNLSLVADILLQDDEMLQLAGLSMKVIHTPGHTEGGVCYLFTDYDILISGDTLFCNDVGRTDLPAGNGRLLIESILSKLMVLKDEIVVYPGHGGPTNIGHEREHNYYLSGDPDMFDS